MTPRGRATIAEVTQLVHVEPMKSFRQINNGTLDHNGTINFRKRNRAGHIATIRGQDNNTAALQIKRRLKTPEGLPGVPEEKLTAAYEQTTDVATSTNSRSMSAEMIVSDERAMDDNSVRTKKRAKEIESETITVRRVCYV